MTVLGRVRNPEGGRAEVCLRRVLLTPAHPSVGRLSTTQRPLILWGGNCSCPTAAVPAVGRNGVEDGYRSFANI
jgi:hypothetical protein